MGIFTNGFTDSQWRKEKKLDTKQNTTLGLGQRNIGFIWVAPTVSVSKHFHSV